MIHADCPHVADINISDFVTVLLDPAFLRTGSNYSQIATMALELLGYDLTSERILISGKVGAIQYEHLALQTIDNPKRDTGASEVDHLTLKIPYQFILGVF